MYALSSTRNNGFILPILISVVLLSFFDKAQAGNNYYFSSSIGDDSRTSLQAQNPNTPWKSITKLNAFFSSLAPGDSILFKRNEVFYGTITPTVSGTLALPIVISAYGTGAKPVITGFTTITGWTNEGGGIYSKVITAASTPNVVTVNGVNTPLGRYPNAGTANNGFLTIDSFNGTTSINDAATPSTETNWTGAMMMVRFDHWLLNRCPVTNHSGTTITYSNLISYTPKAEWGFFFQNHIKTLDQFGEWCYVGGKLSMYFGSSNPDTYNVNISTINRVVSVVSKNYITIHNLNLQGANFEAVYSTGSYIIVKNCNISFCGDNAITLSTNANYNTVDNCDIMQIQNRGILGLATNPTIKNCYIHAIAMLPGMGNSVNKGQTAIAIQGTGVNNSLIEYNRIDSVGYQGILFSGNNSIVRYNHVTNFNFNLDDGAGIYTGGNNFTGRKIFNNVVINNFGITASYGTNVTTVNSMGIYLDDNSTYVEVFNNTVATHNMAFFFTGRMKLKFTRTTSIIQVTV